MKDFFKWQLAGYAVLVVMAVTLVLGPRVIYG